MKMILNMISTITMVQLGRTYKNYMCYIKPCNKKLYMRALNIISDCCAIDTNQASKLLEKTENKIPEAIVMQLMGVELAQAEKALRDSGGSVREACRFLEIEKGESEA
jgi:N-acetylmuramic acid 6-phosphate etherase